MAFHMGLRPDVGLPKLLCNKMLDLASDGTLIFDSNAVVDIRSVALRGLRAGKPVPAPQPAGPSRGVMSLEAGKAAARSKPATCPPILSTEHLFEIKKTAAVAPSLQIQLPAQSFLSSIISNLSHCKGRVSAFFHLSLLRDRYFFIRRF